MTKPASVALAVASFVAILSLCSAAQAQSQYGPRTVLGNFYQQTSNTQSIDGVHVAPCTSTAVCNVLFQAVPSSKAMVIQHVSCLVNPVGGQVTGAYLRTHSGQTVPYRVTDFLPDNAGNSYVNIAVLHLVLANERPFITLNRSGTGDFGLTECSISGQIVTP